MKLSYSIDNKNIYRGDKIRFKSMGAVSSNSNFVRKLYSLPAAAQSSTLYLKFGILLLSVR